MLASLRRTLSGAARAFPPTRGALAAWRRFKVSRRPVLPETTDAPWRLFNVELTNRCPFTCIMCSRTNNMKRDQGLMTFETFQAVVDEYAVAQPEKARTELTWLHHFGESLTHPEFGRFIRYAVSKGVKAAMSVNPLMMTPAVAQDLLDSGVHTLSISLDGHDDESFKAIRGVPNAYQKSKDNLLAFLEKKVATGNPVVVNLSMIDFAKNRGSIERVRAFWEQVPGINVFAAKEFKVWNGDAADVNVLADEQVDNAERRKRNGRVACTIPWQQMSVTWDGDLVPCCYDYDKKYSYGKVKDGIAKAWNGERMRALRREFNANEVTNPLCATCPDLYPPD